MAVSDTMLQAWFAVVAELELDLPEPDLSERLVALALLFDSSGAPYQLSRGAAEALKRDLRQRLDADRAVARLSRPAVLHTERRQLMDLNVDLAGTSDPKGWAPGGVMWTSPQVVDDTSAWSIRLKVTGDGHAHPHRLTFDPGPDLGDARIYDDLRSFDRDIERHRSLSGLVGHLDERGHRVMGFTWNLVFEAELDVLAGVRPRRAAPAHLGVECLMWWRTPRLSDTSVPVQLQDLD